jgi:hypothetical protein
MTAIDEALARHWASIRGLTDTETSAALRMVNDALDMSTREAAMQLLVDSSDNSREHLAAFSELCRLFDADRRQDSH